MAHLQNQFETFHSDIRMGVENATLREKRDVITSRIRKYLVENDLPTFSELLQGSYAMHVGTRPPTGQEYDIDVGLRFPFADHEYSAEETRVWVYNAVKDHTDKVEAKGPCIRVTYAGGYHVDLVIYANWTDGAGNEHFRLAHKTEGWRPADPQALLQFVKETRAPFAGTEDSATGTDQFRRTVRYLKRWNDEHITGESEEKPSGLALLLLTAMHLRPTRDIAGYPDDLQALQEVASAGANTAGRIVATKPAPEYEDIFSRLSDEAMKALKERLASLSAALVTAAAEEDLTKACEGVACVLGQDFPVPEGTAAKTSAPAIVTSSSSA